MTWCPRALGVMVTLKCVGSRAMLAGLTVDLPPQECHGRRNPAAQGAWAPCDRAHCVTASLPEWLQSTLTSICFAVPA